MGDDAVDAAVPPASDAVRDLILIRGRAQSAPPPGDPPPRVTRDRDNQPEADAPQPDPPADSNATRDAPPPADQHDADSGARAPNAPREPFYRLTQGGNAQRFIDMHKHRLRYVADWDAWLAYDKKRWKRSGAAAEAAEAAKAVVRQLFAEAGDARGQAEKLSAQLAEHHPEIVADATSKGRTKADIEARERARSNPQYQEMAKTQDDAGKLMEWAMQSDTAYGNRSMLEMARTDPRIAAKPEDFDVDPLVINVQNGTLDLRTLELRPHRPEDMITRIAAVEYDEEAECVEWDKFLRRIMPEPDMRDWLQRFAGYCLTGLIIEQMLAFLIGEGSNGKSLFCDTMMGMMGDYATVAAPDLLVVKKNEEHPTGFADLAGRRFVVVSEIDHGRKWAEGTIKRLTGDKWFKARGMRENFSTFRNTIKFAPIANSRPELNGTDRGIWRRFRVVKFGVTIPDAEQDTTLVEQFSGELAVGIFAWAVRGCSFWRQEERLPIPRSIAAETAKYQTEQDLIGNWISERCWCTCSEAEQVKSEIVDGVCQTCSSAIPTASEFNNTTMTGQPWEWLRHIQADVRTWCKERDVKPWSWNSVRAELERKTIGERKRFDVNQRTAESRGVSGMWLRELVMLPDCSCDYCEAEAAKEAAKEAAGMHRGYSRSRGSARFQA